ncbi:TolC family protein [Thalassospiraceae bacterium LMO-SO8]|nr:TolC family protein [Alphaproteobacteria bacterium LMO-S08]WND75130.1 TolC family protein [Thalassospiraceae bacterium LMO-SO8]
MSTIKRLAPGMPELTLVTLVPPSHGVAENHELLAAVPMSKGEEPPRKAKAPPTFLAQSFRGFSSLLVAVAALTISFPEEPFAQAPELAAELTFDHALRLAEERSFNLQAQDAKGRSSQERAVSAGSLPDPVLRFSVDNLPVTGSKRYTLTDDFMTMRSVGVTQTFTGSDKRDARRERFEREAELASVMRSVELARLRSETARAWFGRLYQQQILELIERQRDEAVLTAEAVETAYRSARGDQTDVFSAREEIVRIEDRLHEARADLRNAVTLLARWVGDAANFPLGAMPAVNSTRLNTDDMAHQIDFHPDIQILSAQERVALAAVKVAREEKDADWSLSLMFSKRGDNFSDMVSIGASVPLQWNQKNHQDRELTARLHEVAEIRAKRAEMRREHHSEVERMLATWRADLQRLQGYDQSLVPLAAERSKATLAAYRGGKGALATVLDARRMQTDTQLERLRIEKQAATTWAQLEFLMPEPDLSADATNSKSDKEPGQ